MFPLAWIFFAWIALVAVFGFMSLLTLATTVRYGLACSSTYVAAGVFALGSFGVIALTVGYAASIDLTQSFDLISLF
ncbi:hypothetical protein KBD34_00430 [Patescibacteria group bacterium]|nr:hypothetical protein [Patescibacteria group bacterium]